MEATDFATYASTPENPVEVLSVMESWKLAENRPGKTEPGRFPIHVNPILEREERFRIGKEAMVRTKSPERFAEKPVVRVMPSKGYDTAQERRQSNRRPRTQAGCVVPWNWTQEEKQLLASMAIPHGKKLHNKIA